MRRRSIVVVLACAGVAACGGGEDPPGTTRALDPASFSTQLDHPYWPMRPGDRWTYRETDGHGERQTVTVTVTRRTRTVAAGVRVRAVRDTVSSGGRLVEDTLDLYARDAEGTLWYFGEETAEFENGRLATREGSWEAGVDGAEAGILLPARPRPGMRYREEFLRGEAEDRGRVLATGVPAGAPYGFHRDTLLISDTTPLEPTVSELKFYARGVGPLLTLSASGTEREALLTKDRAPGRWVRRAGSAPLGRAPLPRAR